jgi:hypothetical protein
MDEPSIFERAVEYGSYLLAGPLSGMWFMAAEMEATLGFYTEWLLGL